MSAAPKPPPLVTRRPRDLFVAALEIRDAAERSAFLESACGPDTELRKGVEELLAEEQRLGAFLDTPAMAEVPPPDTIPDHSVRRRGRSTAGTESVGDRIGRYKLLQEIGEGGCGSVYMAEQEEPVRRRVALKLIKAGMDTRSVIARFEAERQALALMDHPNIARVLDAGATETGRPYFVMELVRGVRITQFCDENKLATRERLDLFIKVCHAIQHAHQKGVIHRDIKPSNILVTLHDGVPVPKVIDFGIAKAIAQRLTEKTLFTGFEQFIGTPAYMSPEQAEMSGLDVDTRTDIYSLGVLLYEMLSGRTPFDGRELVQSGLDAMRRTIREREPLRPSARVQTLEMADATELLKHRQEKLPGLVKLIRGDLDWIVMQSIAKDRTRRYETADALALDIQRYLDGEPISARPPSRAYRLEKFIHRNKLLVAAGASIMLVLTVGSVVSTWQAVRATRAEHEQSYLLRVAEIARQREVRQHRIAEAERAAALRRAYNSDMNLVPQALQANNYGRVIELLSRHRRNAGPERPTRKADSEADLRQWEWRYFWRQTRSDAAFAFPKQSNAVNSLAMSPDGQFVVSGDRRGTLKLWDLFRRTEVATLRQPRGDGGPSNVRFAFAPQGDRLAILFDEHPRRAVIRVLSTSTRQLISEAALKRSVQAFAFSRDGAQLLLFEEDQPVRAWHYAGGLPPPQSNPPEQRRGPKSGFGPMFSRATFSPNRAMIAVTEGGRVRLIDAASGVEKQSMPAFEQGVAAVAFSPDSELIAVSPLFTEVETVIKLYSTATGKQISQMIGHVSWVPGLAFSSDGQRLISAGGDQTVRIWDAQVPEGKQIAALRGHFSEVTAVAISPDGKTIVSGCKDGTIFGWDAGRLEAKKPYELLQGQVRSIEFVPHSNGLLSVNKDGSVSLWDAATLQERERITALGDNVERIVMSPDGRWLYAGTRAGPIRVLDWTNQVLVTNLTASAGPDSSGTPLAVTDHGRTLVTAGPGSLVRLWNIASGEPRILSSPAQGAPFPRPGFFDVPFALSPDEQFLAVSGPDRAVDLFNLTSGQKQASLNLENWGSMGFAFSHDNAQLAVASSQGTILLWDLSSRNIVDELRGHLMGVNDVTYSPDGARLASASAKNEAVKLWDAATQHEVATLAGEGALFRHVKFSPDGTLLVAINSQGKAHIWRAPALREIDALEQAN